MQLASTESPQAQAVSVAALDPRLVRAKAETITAVEEIPDDMNAAIKMDAVSVVDSQPQDTEQSDQTNHAQSKNFAMDTSIGNSTDNMITLGATSSMDNLPKQVGKSGNWMAMKDPSSGSTYYYHVSTRYVS